MADIQEVIEKELADTVDNEKGQFDLNKTSFGYVLNDVLSSSETITDIKCWNERIIVTDKAQRGEYFWDMSKYTEEQLAEFRKNLKIVPRNLAHDMAVPYNDASPTLDANADLYGRALLRLSAINPSLNADGIPALAFRIEPYGFILNDDLMNNEEYGSPVITELLKLATYCEANIMLSGSTGTGKTVLLKTLIGSIKKNSSVITIEDTLELFADKKYPDMNILSLKTTNNCGYEKILRACLRQDPKVIAITETRGGEVVDLIACVYAGHQCLTTLHSIDAMGIPDRIAAMAMNSSDSSVKINKQEITHEAHNIVDLGVGLDYYNDETGSHRRIKDVVEFYVDSEGKPHRHAIVKFDFATNKYIYNQIQSERLLEKLIRGRISLKAIEGVFI